MNERIIELFKNPKQISPEDLKGIHSAIEKYPYAQALRSLYLYGVHLYDAENYSKILSETAAYTTDKKILYQLINGKKETFVSENVLNTVGDDTEEQDHIVKENITDSEDNNEIIYVEESPDELAVNDEVVDSVQQSHKEENVPQLSFHRTEDYLPKVEFKRPEQQQTYRPREAKMNRHEQEMQRLIAEVEAKMKMAKTLKQVVKTKDENSGSELNFTETSAFIVAKEPEAHQEDITESSPESWEPMRFNPHIPDVLTGTIGHKTDTAESGVTEEIPREENPESNVPQFIATWNSWLKIEDQNEIKTESKHHAEENLPEMDNDDTETVDEEDIIDKFIKNEPKLSRPAEDSSHFVIKERNDDIWHLMTETLANLYVEQRLYTKAIKAFEVLMNKHPERQKYFKDKIKEVGEIRNGK